MNTFFYNTVSESTVLDRKALFEDFKVIKILVKDNDFRFKTVGIPTPKKVLVTYYESWKEIYLLVDKDYNDKPLRKLFEDNRQVLIRDETNFDDDTFLNIVLQYEIKRRNEIEGINDTITNQAYYYYIVESNNHDKCYITLKFRFEDRKLFPHVVTFTQYGKLTPQEKSKNKSPFFKPGPYAMQRVNESDYENKEELFVMRHSKNLKGKEKNTVSMFETSHFDEIKQSKIYYLLKIFDILQHSKYLKNFNFSNGEAQEYKVTETCKTVESLFAQWIKNNVINVVYANRELTKEELSVLTDNKKCQCTQSRDIVSSAYNLVFLNSTTRSNPPSEDDIIRDKNLQSGEVVQHVNIDLLGNAPALEAALRNLMIKSELKAKSVRSFPMDILNGDKTYNFFVVKKMDDDEDGPLYTYHKLTINGRLDILDIQLFMEEDACPYADGLSDEDIGLIEDSEGNAIRLKDSDRVLLPDCLNLANYIFDMEERLGKTITGHDLCTTVQRVIDNENKKAKKDEFEDAFANVCGQNPGLHYHSTKEFPVSEIQKMFPRTLGQRVRAMLNVFYRPKETSIVETYYPQFKNIYFNEKEYMVAPDSSVQKSMTSFVRIKDIETVHGENFFEELIPMMASTVVRNKQLTIAPFPFKYLREAIENPSLIE